MVIWDGNKLIKAREEKRWSRADMTYVWFEEFECHITEQTLFNWEKGNKPPGRMNLLRLTDFFGKPTEYFFKNKSRPKQKVVQKKKPKKFGIF